MSAVTVTISDEASAALTAMRQRAESPADMYAALAVDTERYLKDYGTAFSAVAHKTARRLGAAPTNHLAEAYQDIAAESDAQSARLTMPRASRLRAAFGEYTAVPGEGKKYLTIPVTAEAYGKRAPMIEGLFFLRAGPKKTPMLAKREGKGIKFFYFLSEGVTIPEDPKLILWDKLASRAAKALELYLLTEPDTPAP